MKQQKCIFITYNQAYHPLILRILHKNTLKGYTTWTEVAGQGSADGEPHLGSHAWPTMNSAMMVICDEDRVDAILSDLHQLDTATPEQGLRAFVMPVEKSI
ncbi:PG0541 family transporter-associated protein [Porphyromonas pogonae]|uniref:PG0541 family transporter-associated protein n=1 Tax=Porphyromonas pogonae TaxID=867595 RepID=UPI002E77A8B6|nr:PG0541 family transporter-associated protein [Porphyromonas pogonae]